MRKIVIQAGGVSIRARLLDTPTAERIWAALPIQSAARTWGEEIYFDAPVSSEAEPDARVVVKAGDIVFWPDGDAISIGFGPTPLSKTRGEIRLAGPCNVWAQALDDVRLLKSVHPGVAISVSEADA
ncbi:cyclophilin-like fold protein [Hyphomicrobium sp. 2TAF46]|uniref:cyclophilin-like fold protein n=1 Tax=Hyphomicrobium sp. 2TAF46 TaxID=3233019 RepID=UPI003F92E48A